MSIFKKLFQNTFKKRWERPTDDFDFSLGHSDFYSFKKNILTAADSKEISETFLAVLTQLEQENHDGFSHLLYCLGGDNDLSASIIVFHKTYPEHWFANILLGLCLRNISDEERDGAYLNQLSKKQYNIYFESMDESKVYLEKALALNPNCWIACNELMNYHSALGDDFSIIENYYKRSIQIEPRGIWSRIIFYDSLLPKWSGFDWEVSLGYLEEQLDDETIPLRFMLLLDYVNEYGIFLGSGSDEDDAWEESETVKKICLKVAKHLIALNADDFPWSYIKACNQLLLIFTQAVFEKVPADIITLSKKLKPEHYWKSGWDNYDYSFKEIHGVVVDIQNGIVPRE